MTIKVGSTDVQSIYIGGGTVETTEAWTRPNVTSATSNGTITWGPVGTSGTEDGWHAYDGSDTSRYVPSNSNSYLQWVLPYTLRFYPTSTFVCKGRTDSSEGNDNNIYRFYVDSDKTIPMTALFSRVERNQTKTIASTLTAPVDTNTIYLDVTGETDWSGFTDINFTGVDKVVTAPGTIPVQSVYVGSTKIWPAGSYSGLNATGDASSYAFPVSAGTITDGTHTATLSQNSSITLSWPGTHTTTYVVLGVNGQLSAHTSLTTAPEGFVIYYVHVEPETYGLTPYWDITKDNRPYAEYVGQTWYKWTGTYSGITTSYYTTTRNPALYDRYYYDDFTTYGSIQKVDESGGSVTAIWTQWDSTTQQGYSYSYDGVAS